MIRYVFVGFLITNMLGAMDHIPRHHRKCLHYAVTEDAYLARGVFVQKTMYPLFIKSSKDNKVHEWINFDCPVRSFGWDVNGKYILDVTLENGRKHRLPFNHLDSK